MVYINSRCKNILDMLLKADYYISLKQIAEELNVSKRSIYYDICKLNEWLNYYHISELEIIRGKGIHISEIDKEKITKVVEGNNREEKYILSPTERIELIYCYILISHLSESVYIEQISEYCNVSRNTIFNDLHVLVNRIKEYDLTLEYTAKTGYKIGGDVVNIRAMFFIYFNNIKSLFSKGMLDFIYKEPVKEYLQRLEAIASELKTKYVDGVLLTLAALVPLMYKGRRRPHFSNLKRENVVNTEEYRLVKKYFPDLDDKEHIFLCIHLLGSRISTVKNDMFENYADQSVYEITKALVAEFEKRACVFFENREELERSLFQHINSSLYRYRYGVPIGNCIVDDVIREYGDVFEITRKVSKYLEQLIGLPISDNEVAYLSLHFGSHLKTIKEAQKQLKILIVCVDGISTGDMLKREVKNLLPECKIVGVVSAIDTINVAEICNLVITTAKIDTIVPVVKVHPVLTDYDRTLILKYGQAKSKEEKNMSKDIYGLVKKYVSPEKYEDLKCDLEGYFNDNKEMFFQKKQPGFIEILKKRRIEIIEADYKWQEAIRVAGNMLIEAESIEKCYLDKIISQLLFYGPFMFLTQGIILAHAKPEDGVKKMDVSMSIFKHPVYFSEYYQAKIVITLAVEDQYRHLRILNDIMTIFEDESNIENIAEMNSIEEIISAMERIIEKNQSIENMK